MDLRQTMLHIWAVGSVAWLAHWSWETWSTCTSAANAALSCSETGAWLDLAVSALGVPLAALLVGAAIVWGMKGMRRTG